MKPKDELYIFVYDKDQIFVPSVSRVYGSDFRKISDVRFSKRRYMKIEKSIEQRTISDKNARGQIWPLPIL